MATQNGESRAGERGSLNGGGGAGLNSGCGGLNLFGNIRPLGRRVQPPPRENSTPPLEFTPGQVPYTLDSRHPGSMLSLRALHHHAYDGHPAGVPRLAKQIKVGANPDEIVDYEKWATFFSAQGLDFSTFERALNALEYLQGKPHVCLVYGALSDDATPANMRKLIYDTPGKKNPNKIFNATLIDKASWWLSVDIDKLSVPPEIHGLREQAAWVLLQLPPEFHGVRCVVSATGSYGIRGGARLRFWFLLDKPLTCSEKRAWLCKARYVDLSIYTPNQPIYVSGPVFEGDPQFDDPLYDMPRIITLDGDACVVTPSAERLKPPPRSSYHAPSFHADAASKDTSYGLSTLGAALYLIYNATNKPTRPRHEWIRIACQMVAQPIILGLLNADSALEQLIIASVSIGKEEQETRNLFDWALRVTAEDIARENNRGSRREEE